MYKYSIEDMQKVAALRGGKCLSDDYVNNSTKLEFECSEGHRWWTRPGGIQQGRWCPQCKYIQMGIKYGFGSVDKNLENEDLFYYAGGRKVRLIREPVRFAVDTNRLAALGIAKKELKSIRGFARSLRHGYLLVDRKAISAAMMKKLGKTGAVQPVYRYGKGWVTFLPEIRIEDGDKALVARIVAFAQEMGAEVSLDYGSRVVLCPSSNLSEDAVDLANRIYEGFHPELVQARMIRIVPK